MIRKLLKGAKGHEVSSIMTMILVMLETALEVFLPLLMANILNTMQLYAATKVENGVLTANLIYYDFDAGRLETAVKGTLIMGHASIMKNTVLS